MIALKTHDEIDAIAAAGAILDDLFGAIEARVAPGVTTAELDAFAEAFIRERPGAEPAFKGLYGFPASLCTSINDEVVHGIPSRDRPLADGDIVSIDAGVKLDGWFADMARTFAVGTIDADAEHLLHVTEAALHRAIDAASAGNRLGDIGYAVQSFAEGEGFNVVRELVGHGLGRAPHEDPQVPNFGSPGRGLMLRPGLVLAIEPMLNEGTARVRTLADKWTVVTADHRRSAHFEHTVAITTAAARILTSRNGQPDAGHGSPARGRASRTGGAGRGEG